MKPYCLGLIAIAFGFSVFAATPSVEPTPIVVEEIIAKVNGDIVTKGDIERAMREAEAEAKKQNLQGQKLEDALKQHNQDILRGKIDQLLLVQKGKELGINVDTELSKYMAELQKQSKIADPEKFQQYVKEEVGMPFEDFKNDARNGILTRRVIGQEVSSRISVPHKDVEDYYNAHKAEFIRKEQVFLREILVSADGKTTGSMDAALKKAKDLVARAKKGEKFPEMARDNSDAVTAQSGGDLGGFVKGQLTPEIENVVWSQPKGFVSDPLKVANGYLIVKVEDHQKEGQAALEDVQSEVMDKLFSPKMEPAVREYLTKLRTQAFLEIKKGYIDTGAAAGQDTTWMSTAELKPETVTKGEVANKKKHKRLLGAVPIPGTTAASTSSSK
jgi:parvulin-like peptidyl-prolyl isomerase